MREECSSLGELAGHRFAAVRVVGDELAAVAEQWDGWVRVRASAVLHRCWFVDGPLKSVDLSARVP